MNPIKYFEFEYGGESYVVPREWLEEHDKQIREHIVNQCIFIIRRNSSNGYRDIDGDWVEPYCNTRDVIDEIERLREE